MALALGLTGTACGGGSDDTASAAMAAVGLPDDAVEHGDFTELGGLRAAEALMARHPGLDGLVVASDLMAVGALEVLAATGRR